MKNTTKTIVAIFTAILFSTNASAQVKAIEPNNFSVKYVGSEEGYIYFDVTMPSNTTQNSFVKVEDAKEGELLSETFSKNASNIKFKIEKRDGQEIKFKVYVDKKVYEKSFTANTRLLETTIVDEKTIAAKLKL